MQIQLPWRSPGQARPFGSIPRINWSHPLTKGLISYMYDCNGVIIDLVGGSLGYQASWGTSPVLLTRTGTKWGGVLKHTGQTAGGLVSDSISCQHVPGTDNMCVTPPYSWASGHIKSAQPTAGIAWMFAMAGAGNTQFAFADNVSSAPVAWFANSGSNASATTDMAIGAFTTLVGVCASATSGTIYHMNSNGLYETGTTGAVTLDATTNTFPTFFENNVGTYPAGVPGTLSGSGSFFNGSIFYGATWAKRALTAAEAQQIHADPYCVLLYPEDDMFSALVGVISAAGLTLFSQQRIFM